MRRVLKDITKDMTACTNCARTGREPVPLSEILGIPVARWRYVTLRLNPGNNVVKV